MHHWMPNNALSLGKGTGKSAQLCNGDKRCTLPAATTSSALTLGWLAQLVLYTSADSDAVTESGLEEQGTVTLAVAAPFVRGLGFKSLIFSLPSSSFSTSSSSSSSSSCTYGCKSNSVPAVTSQSLEKGLKGRRSPAGMAKQAHSRAS